MCVVSVLVFTPLGAVSTASTPVAATSAPFVVVGLFPARKWLPLQQAHAHGCPDTRDETGVIIEGPAGRVVAPTAAVALSVQWVGRTTKERDKQQGSADTMRDT